MVPFGFPDFGRSPLEHKTALTFSNDGAQIVVLQGGKLHLLSIFTDTRALIAYTRKLLGRRDLTDTQRRRLFVD